MTDVLARLIKPDYVILGIVFLALVALIIARRIPDIQGTVDLINALNTKGGNILVLTCLTLIFFWTGFKFLMYVFDLMVEGKLTPDNAMLAVAFQWISASAFGGSIAALFKTMSPESLTTVSKPASSTTVTATKTVTQTTEPPTQG